MMSISCCPPERVAWKGEGERASEREFIILTWWSKLIHWGMPSVEIKLLLWWTLLAQLFGACDSCCSPT